MSYLLAFVILVFAAFVGKYFGKEIPGTTIGGLKFAMGFWAVVISLLLSAVLVGLFGSISLAGFACGAGIAVVGAAAGLAIGAATTR